MCTEFVNTKKGFVGVCLVSVYASIAPYVFLFRCNNGAAFLTGELHSFLGFLPGLTELVGVTGSVAKAEVLSDVLMLLSLANVAET